MQRRVTPDYYFHPGDIIMAVRGDYPIYSPNKLAAVFKLACHILGEGHDHAYLYMDANSNITNYYEFRSRILNIQPDLRKQFPELVAFAESLDKQDLQKIKESPHKTAEFIKEIEKQFGEQVMVLTRRDYQRLGQHSRLFQRPNQEEKTEVVHQQTVCAKL